MFKVDRNLLSSHLIKSCYHNSEIHHYCTRSSDNYHLESVNTNIKRFSINHKGPILWNSIPPSIRALNNINQFKRHVIDTLLENINIKSYDCLIIMYSISFLSFFFGGFLRGCWCFVLSCVYYLFFITWVARISGASAPWVLPVTPVSYMLS